MNTGAVLVFIAAILWATDAPFRAYLTHGLDATVIVFGEHAIDVLFSIPIIAMLWRELKNISKREWAALLFIAVCGSALGSILFTQSFSYVNPSVAILMQKLQPIIAISLAAIFLKEPLTKQFFSCAALALFAAYLISFPSLVPQLYPGEVFNPNVKGVLLALGAAFVWGTSTVLGRYVLHRLDFKLVTALRFSGAFLFLLPLVLINGSLANAQFTATDFFFILIIALVSGVASLLIYYRGLTTTRASIATIAELGFPMAAVFINWIFIPNSGLAPIQLLGTALLLFSVYQLSRENSANQVTI